jgi:hypothetical protein
MAISLALGSRTQIFRSSDPTHPILLYGFCSDFASAAQYYFERGLLVIGSELNRVGLQEDTSFESSRDGWFVQDDVATIFDFGRRDAAMGYMSPRLLNQSTHSRVANSTAWNDRDG